MNMHNLIFYLFYMVTAYNSVLKISILNRIYVLTNLIFQAHQILKIYLELFEYLFSENFFCSIVTPENYYAKILQRTFEWRPEWRFEWRSKLWNSSALLKIFGNNENKTNNLGLA